MLDISQEQAFEHAYHFKLHKKKLKEIKEKGNTLDNHLPETYQRIGKRIGFRAIYWTEKINRENKLLLDKLIKIKQQKHQVSASFHESKSIKLKSLHIENEMLVTRIANVNPSLSTKNILKDSLKYREYSHMRAKITQKKFMSLKNLHKVKLPSLSHDFNMKFSSS